MYIEKINKQVKKLKKVELVIVLLTRPYVPVRAFKMILRTL